MPNRLHKIVTILEDDGQNRTVRREYATWSFEGESHPRDVEITPEERRDLYGAAYAVSTAILAEAVDAKALAESERDGWRASAESHKAKAERLDAQLAKAAARVRELEEEKAGDATAVLRETLG